MFRACRPARAERGITLIGLLLWAIVVAFVALMIVRVLPTVNEYSTILRAVQTIAKAAPATVAEARIAFDKQKEIEYSISSIGGKDLQVTKENDKVVIRFAYDKEIEIFEPVFLLIKYRGVGRSN
jgi:type II secretory pathway pseudopilin PulG